MLKSYEVQFSFLEVQRSGDSRGYKYILWTCVCVRALHEEKGKKENENGRKE